MNKFILSFKEAHKELDYLIGKHAAELSSLIDAGFPIIDGFIVTPNTYFSFLHQNNLIKKISDILSVTSINNPESVLQASTHIKRIVTESTFPADLATSIHNSCKNLSGIATGAPVNIISGKTGESLHHKVYADTNLIRKIQESWASYFTPQVIINHLELGLDYFKDGVSLVIQKYIEQDESGVVLTGNPVNNDTSLIIIEVKGVHEHYEIQKNTLKVTNRVVSTKTPHLTFDQVKTLALLGKKLEAHLYFPQEIYWIIAENNIYIQRSKHLPFSHDLKQLSSSLPKNLNLLAKGVGVSTGIVHGTVKIIKKASDFATILHGDIIVANDVPHNYLPAIKKSTALITETGGRTSPYAFFSRGHGIPSVTNVKKATSILKPGQIIMLNGLTGEIYAGGSHLSRQKTATRIFLNLNQAFSEDLLTNETTDGIIYAGQQESDLEERLEKIAKLIYPHPVIYKITDFANIYGNKLGFRGTYRALHNNNFKKELVAIRELREKNNLKNLGIMLPFVRSVKELALAKEIMKDCGLHRDTSFKLWLELSTPASIINLEELIKTGIDGICVNIDELTMLLTGVDEKASEVAAIFDPLDESVAWAIEKVVKSAHNHGITSTITGKSALHHQSILEKSIRFGVSGICVPINHIHTIKEQLVSIEKRLVQ